jgi:hypothetical protein
MINLNPGNKEGVAESLVPIERINCERVEIRPSNANITPQTDPGQYFENA